MNAKQESSLILTLTNFCKGIAIFWVVLVHFKSGWFGWQGVHVFLILSGFGLTYSCAKSEGKIQWKSWFYKRFKRILPAYWIAVLGSVPFLLFLDIGPKPGVEAGIFKTFLDFFLLNNVFEQFRGGGTGAFWYVPLIVGAYLLFPWMYGALKKCSKPRHYLTFFGTIAAIEFSYRAIAIYALDGQPIGYSEKFLTLIPQTVEALNQQPNWLFELFQHRAPFGFIPSRLTEFAMGMMAGLAAFHKPRQFDRILFSRYAGFIGFGFWLASQTLMYVGLWGWIFADCAISLGLIVWLLNFARFCQTQSTRIFQIVTTLGIWSYYIYLTHHPLARFFPRKYEILVPEDSSVVVRFLVLSALFAATIACIAGMSWLLAKFDRSRYPQLMMDAIVGGWENIGECVAIAGRKCKQSFQLLQLSGLWILVSLVILCSMGSALKFTPVRFEAAKKIEQLKKQQHRIASKIDRILNVK